MTAMLGDIVQVGATSIATVVQHEVTGKAGPFGVVVHGERRPIAILVATDKTLRAFDPDGTTMTLADFDYRFPGLRAHFEKHVQTSA